jgi:hypothetical protein
MAFDMGLHKEPLYGPHMSSRGYLAKLGLSQWSHRFGGASWKFDKSNYFHDGPTLLLTLDLTDSSLTPLRCQGLQELPVCSYINNSIWSGRQVFQLYPATHVIGMVHQEVQVPEPLAQIDLIPNPLPEHPLQLIPMTESDVPLDEKSYWDICEKFVGGDSFIRILGSPIWMQRVEREDCTCGLQMTYACSTGYNVSEPGEYLSGEPFFIGEGVLYFFLCRNCLKLTVISQSI